MGVLRAVHAHRGNVASAHPAGSDVEPSRFTRGRQRQKGVDRSGIVDDPEPSTRQPEALGQPGERLFLDLRCGGRCPPEHTVHVEGRGEELTQDAGARSGDGEVGEESRMVPVGDARENRVAVLIEEHGHGSRLSFRPQRTRNVTRVGGREHRNVANPVEVTDDLVDHRVAVAPKLLQVVVEWFVDHAESVSPDGCFDERRGQIETEGELAALAGRGRGAAGAGSACGHRGA